MKQSNESGVDVATCGCCGERMQHIREIVYGVCVRCEAFAKWLIEDSKP